MRVLVTGASGFVGRALCCELEQRGYHVRLAMRTRQTDDQEDIITTGDIGPQTDWEEALNEVDIIVHLAARVHMMNEKPEDSLDSFRYVNVDGTKQLARKAVDAGVKRFVFLSTVKVNGEKTYFGANEFTEKDTPEPQEPYAISKWEAEQVLNKIAAESNLEVVIIRPPLIYGPDVKANFLRLIQLVAKGVPLPLAGIKNQRSLIALDNLIDFIILCMEHVEAAGQTYLVSDGENLTISELIRRLSAQMKIPARLFFFPISILKFFARLSGKMTTFDRLCSDLRVDISKAKDLTGWVPLVRLDEGLKRTVEWYQDSCK